MRSAILSIACVAALSSSACLSEATSAGQLQLTAHEFNMNARIGRMEMTGEHIASSYRDEYVRHHQAWGSVVRIADTESAGMNLTASDHASVDVRVSWYLMNEGDLRSTVVRQKWTTQTGRWVLEGEERAAGDIGLLGERIEVAAPEHEREHAMFPTVRLGAD